MRAWWTSGKPEERQNAAALCATCPVREPCLTWSLSLPPDDNTVYPGLGADERRSARQELAAGNRAPGQARREASARWLTLLSGR